MFRVASLVLLLVAPSAHAISYERAEKICNTRVSFWDDAIEMRLHDVDVQHAIDSLHHAGDFSPETHQGWAKIVTSVYSFERAKLIDQRERIYNRVYSRCLKQQLNF